MPPCGCGGSQQQQVRRPGVQRPVPASSVPGGPGEPGYTWDGPKKAHPRRSPAADVAKR